MKFSLVIFVMYFLICSINNNQIRKNKSTSVTIYSLPLYTKYLINVNCNEICRQTSVLKNEYYTENKILKIYNLLTDSTNFKEVNNISELDVRVRVEFKNKENIIDEYCMSLHYLKHNNKYYKHNNNLIQRILKETQTKPIK